MYSLWVICIVAHCWIGAWSYLIGTSLDCNYVCQNQLTSDTVQIEACNCPTNGHNDAESTAELTTLSMCDYLCSIQMGGSACDCSVSLVPGRK